MGVSGVVGGAHAQRPGGFYKASYNAERQVTGQ
jgi:hypothetical protein